jgi:tRNA1(Val) A37 N6-methylase TrmN6
MNSGPMANDDVTTDAVLGGRLQLRQPRRGHRVGHDAILLAAATQGLSGEHAVELGAGVGAAGLALAWRCPGLAVALVDNDEALVALAADNARANGLADRVRAVALDVAAAAARFAEAGLTTGSADRVLMNPPFNDPQRQQASPDESRRAAHVAEPDTLAAWVAAASRLLQPGGTLTLIYRAESLADVLAALAPSFGAITVTPVHAKPAAPAIRVLVSAIAQSRAALTVQPGLILAEADGRPSRAAEAILRDAQPLSGT